MNDLVDAPTQAITALREPEQGVTIFWYEQLKADMSFDPEAPSPEIEDPEDWNLDEDYPRSLSEHAHDLACQLADEDPTGFLYRMDQLLTYLASKEQEGATA